MFSKIAEIDLKTLREAGYSPTDEDVIELNDLGVRIERGKDATVCSAPRVAVAGNVFLYEPTVAMIMWWHDFGKDSAESSDARMDAYFFALANARKPDVFAGLTDPAAIREAVSAWKRGVCATDVELWRALLWVKHGENAAVKHVDQDADEMYESLYAQVIAAAGAMSLRPADLATSTPTELVALLVAANLHARIPMKASVAELYMAYQQRIREIETRKDAGKDGQQA